MSGRAGKIDVFGDHDPPLAPRFLQALSCHGDALPDDRPSLPAVPRCRGPDGETCRNGGRAACSTRAAATGPCWTAMPGHG